MTTMTWGRQALRSSINNLASQNEIMQSPKTAFTVNGGFQALEIDSGPVDGDGTVYTAVTGTLLPSVPAIAVRVAPSYD